ncbi:hypothetical protein CMQ_2832 [Grosmannia clavigera kw1407]|uniref:Uncharacterized protein n=1 Tax=Grosmannia clavigera (strain kw1407 / UAMH 11150) TaxID=655863 RepID=F0XGS0_GROCL|nr:uncharacterized protein CMQ_2832 [Grosmannia clavigera kw1407]EFX02903.1 hypothetical protein CMQ_2832 [Grosmannia clavigera kw1407]
MSSRDIDRGSGDAEFRVKSESLEPPALSDLAVPVRKPKKPRHATVYDAVAGKYSMFKKRVPVTSTHDFILAPEDVLFQHPDAPTRYHEKDIYFTNEDLPNAGEGLIPNSELLDEVHTYTSRFYEALAIRAEQRLDRTQTGIVNARLLDERSMDETALIAFGILLEEAGRHILGARGDLVFTEADDEDDDESEETEGGGEGEEAESVHTTGRSVDSKEPKSADSEEEEREQAQKKQRLKRRKLSGRRQTLGSDDE